jgi:3'-phosphoadenosine 5'-phosphosulfate sulfotransferase (PAPS reductase)/FAD synthetase
VHFDTSGEHLVNKSYASLQKQVPASHGNYPLAISLEIAEQLAANAPVALSTSGGKDSSAMTLAVSTYLDEIGHRGPRLLIHSDLGHIEWKESLPMCQRLADRVGMELVVVKRQAGDLLDRWRVRWSNNCERYASLSCVKMILPWSTASMLFCRSELKAAIICRDLVERFPQQIIISASGIRRDESTTRAKAPIWSPQARLTSKTYQTTGLDWHPILEWTLEQVFAYHDFRDFPLHEAYTRFLMSRVSCSFCILAGLADLIASTTCPDNHAIYRELVAIEVLSTYSFQDTRWLGDIAPHLLSEEMRAGLEEAKRRAVLREAAEARIPKHLLYSKGWPTSKPSYDEARLLAEVRVEVAQILGLAIRYTDPDAILDRYDELIEQKRLQDEAKARKQARALVLAGQQEGVCAA